MAAMDYALNIGKKRGEEFTEKILKIRTKSEYVYSFDDPFKLILDFRKRGYRGYDVAEILEKEFGIFSEVAVESCVLLMISWGNTANDFNVLEKALDYIENLPPKEFKNPEIRVGIESKSVKTPREVSCQEKEKIFYSESEGKIAAQEVTIFPPCIPIFMPGEVVKKEHISIINNAIEANLNITGLENGYINIVKE